MTKPKKPALLEWVKRIFVKPSKDGVTIGVKVKF